MEILVAQLECHALEDEFSFISIRFTTTVQLDGSDFLSEYFQIPRVTPKGDGEVLDYFQQVYLNATTQNTSKLFRIRGNLELILAWLVEHTPQALVEESGQPEADMSVEGMRRRETAPTPFAGTHGCRWWWITWWDIPRNPSTPSSSPAWRT